MGHRWKPSTGSCVAPWWQSPARCTPSSSLPTPCLAVTCSLAIHFSSSLGIPCQGLCGDARLRFSQRVTNPTSFSSFYFYFYWPLICLGSQSIVSDFVWPFHIYDSRVVVMPMGSGPTSPESCTGSETSSGVSVKQEPLSPTSSNCSEMSCDYMMPQVGLSLSAHLFRGYAK